mgnify:CR=1 FL=1
MEPVDKFAAAVTVLRIVAAVAVEETKPMSRAHEVLRAALALTSFEQLVLEGETVRRLERALRAALGVTNTDWCGDEHHADIPEVVELRTALEDLGIR